MSDLQKSSLAIYAGIEFPFVKVDGKPWFHAQTVTGFLGFKNSHTAIKLHCRDEHKTKWHFGASGRPATYLSVAGVCRLCFKSSSPKALEFQDWVTDDVLPTILENGGYINPEATEKQLEALQSEILVLRKEKQKHGLQELEARIVAGDVEFVEYELMLRGTRVTQRQRDAIAAGNYLDCQF